MTAAPLFSSYSEWWQLMMTACESSSPCFHSNSCTLLPIWISSSFWEGGPMCPLRQAHLSQSGCCCCCCRCCLLIWEANDDGWAVPHLKLMTTLRGEEGRAPPTSSLVCIVCSMCSGALSYQLHFIRLWCIILPLGMLHRDKRWNLQYWPRRCPTLNIKSSVSYKLHYKEHCFGFYRIILDRTQPGTRMTFKMRWAQSSGRVSVAARRR